jgi:hypothetical protein
MFSLIISIISIALVAALAAATVYFGGSAFNKGADDALASTFINSAQQVGGAFTMALTDGAVVTNVASLQTQSYLAQVPSYKNTTIEIDSVAGNFVTVPVSDPVCAAIKNRAAGVTTNTAATVAAEAVITVLPTTLYGCVNTNGTAMSGTSGDALAFYKVK